MRAVLFFVLEAVKSTTEENRVFFPLCTTSATSWYVGRWFGYYSFKRIQSHTHNLYMQMELICVEALKNQHQAHSLFCMAHSFTLYPQEQLNHDSRARQDVKLFAAKVMFTNSYAMESLGPFLHHKIFLKQKAEIGIKIVLVLLLSAVEQTDARQTKMTALR